MKCIQCGNLLTTVDNLIPREQCKCCRLFLTLDEFREGHKRCKTCESIKYVEWKDKHREYWCKGGKYYKYKKIL